MYLEWIKKGDVYLKKSYTCGLAEIKPSNVLEYEQFRMMSPYIPTDTLFAFVT
jgi:hypothetical protein